MAKERKKLTLQAITAIKNNAPIQETPVEETPPKIKLKDLEKFAKSVRFPLVWKDEIENHIDYPTDLSSFIVEAIKEKMERENMNIFIG